MKNRDLLSSHENISLYIPSDIITHESSNSFLKNLVITKIGYYNEAYGHNIYRDNSSEYIMLYCISGKGWVFIGGKRWEVAQGDLVFCDINCPHGYGAHEEKPWSIYWAHFVGYGVPELFELNGISQHMPILHIGENLKVISFIEESYSTLSDGYNLQNLLYSSTCFQNLFSYIIKLNMYSGLQNSRSLDIEAILAYMKDNISSDMSLEHFAAFMNISKYHFARKFKQAIGYSPMEYFNRLKIQKACELLDTSSFSINKISDLLGFNNPNYFSEVFRKITSYSPKEYRNLHLSNVWDMADDR